MRRLEGPSETYEADSEKSVASQPLQALQDECGNPEQMRLAVENRQLRVQLRRYGDTAALILFFESPAFPMSIIVNFYCCAYVG